MRVLLMSKSGAGLLAVLLLIAGMVRADDKEREPFAILEIGGAGEWGLRDGGSSFGPSAAAEFDVVKEWLEIETGSWSVPVQNGRTRTEAARSPLSLRSTLCFGRGLTGSSGGFWSRPTAIHSVEAMNNLSQWVSVCSLQFPEDEGLGRKVRAWVPTDNFP